MAICHQWSWRGFEVNTKDNAENGVLVPVQQPAVIVSFPVTTM
jgi:hypothetical protein